MKRLLPCFACIAVALPAQGNDLLGAIVKAEAAIKGKKNEEAALILRDAQKRAARIESAALRARMQSTIRDMLNKADRLVAQRKKAEGDAARALLSAAELYAKSTWLQTASDLAALAAEFDPDLAGPVLAELDRAFAPERQRLRGLSAEPDRPTDNRAFVDWFKGGRQPWDTRAWRLEPEAIESPTLGPETTVFSTRQLGRKGKASVQVSIGNRVAGAALGFAVKTVHSYCLLSLSHREKDSICAVLRWNGKEYEILLSKAVVFSPEARAAWQTLALEFDGPMLKVRIGEGEWLEVESPVRDFSGALALYVPAAKEGAPVRFRNLVAE